MAAGLSFWRGRRGCLYCTDIKIVAVRPFWQSVGFIDSFRVGSGKPMPLPLHRWLTQRCTVEAETRRRYTLFNNRSVGGGSLFVCSISGCMAGASLAALLPRQYRKSNHQCRHSGRASPVYRIPEIGPDPFFCWGPTSPLSSCTKEGKNTACVCLPNNC